MTGNARGTSGPYLQRLIALAVMLFVITLARPAAIANAQTADASQVAFGNEIARLLRESEFEQLLAYFTPTETTCPMYTPGGLLRICEGKPDGTVVKGYASGVLGSDAGVSTEADALAGLAYARNEFFRSTDIRLYTVANSGSDQGSLACPECYAIVLSTPSDIKVPSQPPQAPGHESSSVAIFQVTVDASGDPRIHSFSIGGVPEDRSAMVDGGTLGSQRFVRVGVLPPGTGTGSATAKRFPPALAGLGIAFLVLSSGGVFALRRAHIGL